MALEQVGAQAVLEGLQAFMRGAEQMESALKGVGDQAEKQNPKLKSLSVGALALGTALGTIAGGIIMGGLRLIGDAVGGVAGQLGSTVTAAGEAATATAQLQAVLTSTGGVAGVTAEQAVALSESWRDLTGASDEAVLGAESVLLRFTRIGSEVFPEALTAVMNMSTAMGISLPDAALKVGRALQDPVEGAAALTRAGVKLTDSQQELIKSFVKAGDVAGAQGVILAQLERQFGGVAEAIGAQLPARVTLLQEKFGDLKEVIGGAITPVLTLVVNKAIDLMGELITAVQRVTADPAFIRWSAQMAAAISVVIDGLAALARTFSQTFVAIARIVITVGQIIFKALQLLNPFARHSPSLVEQVEVGVDDIIAAYSRIREIEGTLESAATAIERLGDAARMPGKNGLDTLKGAADAAKDAVSELETKVRDAQGRIRELAGTPITGERAVEDEAFGLEQERKKAQLEVIARKQELARLESGGAGKETIEGAKKSVEAAQDVVDAISLQMDALRIRADLAFDPLKREIEDLAEPIKELPFEEITRQIKEQQDIIALSESKLGPAREAYNTLALAVDQYNKRVEESAGAGGGAGGIGGLDDLLEGIPKDGKFPDLTKWTKQFDEAEAEYKKTIKPIFEDINSKLEAMNGFLDLSVAGWTQLEIEGKKAMSAIVELIIDLQNAYDKMGERFDKVLKAMGISTAEFSKDWDKMMRENEEVFGLLKKAFDILVGVLQNTILFNPFTKLIEAANDLLELWRRIAALGGQNPNPPKPSSEGGGVGAEPGAGKGADTGVGASGRRPGPPPVDTSDSVISRQSLSSSTAFRPALAAPSSGMAAAGASIQVGPNYLQNEPDIATLAYHVRRFNPAPLR